jgi:hypothetical protein
MSIDTLGGGFDVSAGPDPYHYLTSFVLRKNASFHSTDPGVLTKRPCFWKAHASHFASTHRSLIHMWTPERKCRRRCDHCAKCEERHQEELHREERQLVLKEHKAKKKEDKEDMLINMMKMLVENLASKNKYPKSDDESCHEKEEPEKEKPKTDLFHKLLFERFAAATEVSSIKLLEGLLCRVPCEHCDGMRKHSYP